MDIFEVIKNRRTVRKLKQEEIEKAALEKLVEAARLAPSAGNRQPLEYLVVDTKERKDIVFPRLRWAAYIAPDGNPSEEEKPAAYIIVLIRKELKWEYSLYDAGAAVENILLGAASLDLGTCWIGSIDRENLRKEMEIPEDYIIDCVIAIGKPAETPVTEELVESVRYYKKQGVLQVPKRNLKKIIHWNKIRQ